MRVAFLNRGRETHPGGDIIALDATMVALRRKGVECIETGWDTKAIASGGFDLCHIFHSNFDWSWGNYKAVSEARFVTRIAKGPIEYVLTPIYYPGVLAGITQQQLNEIVLNARLVLPFSHREAKELRDSVGYFPYDAIPNGTDPMFHCTTPASERQGVLCVSARGCEDKGVPVVREACKRLNLPFTCATGIGREELVALYKSHRVFVNNSDSERMSLTVGEALCAGCRVMCHEGNRGNEWYPHLIRFSDFEEDHLKEVYLSHFGNPYDPSAVARTLTWDYVADRLIEVYKWSIR